ncbi:MAG TPA: putative toxin-antitoxin system toxin component, PIN family [Thermodesulfovibrionales bacterium]|nr:putative toxin-antitoxin system toxin component, PIN family [Thermodesulfovibrionales bacterium]
MRVVFDSNIFISALTLPGGKGDAAVLRVIDGKDTLIISREIIDEVLTVLAKKFSKDAEALSRVAVNLVGIGEIVRPSEWLKVFDGDSDNRILECAVAGNAEAIVTGDKAMLMLRKYRHVRIISLTGFLRRG